MQTVNQCATVYCKLH